MPQSMTGPLFAAFVFAAALAPDASAQELSEREFLADYPTVLSASRLRQNLSETPQAVTIIDRQMIRASGAREVAELFRLVPGFTVSYVTYVKGLQPLVTYHGLGREFFSRLQVLIDGRSINNATLGGVDWSEFPLALDDIERIEVIRGPSNATHGIGAFLATVSFVTRHASQQPGASASASAGSDGIRDGHARYAGGAGGIDYRITLGHRADEGFESLADSRSRDFGSARVDWQVDHANSLMLQAGATDGSNGLGTNVPGDPERTADVETSYAQLKWERSLGPDGGYHLQLYHYRFRLIDDIPDSRPASGPVLLDGGSTVRRTDLEFQQNIGSGPDWRWVWGASLREDRTDVPLVPTEVGRVVTERLFGHAEWHASERFLVNAGAMVERNDLTGTDVAPRLALNYRAAPGHAVRFNLARALRTPTAIENQSRFAVGAPGSPRFGPSGDLYPETIVSRELSWIAELPRRDLTLDLKLFDDRVDELIDLTGERSGFPAAAFPRNAVNFDEADQRGIEAQVVWRPDARTLVMGSAAHVRIDSGDRLDRHSSSSPRNTFHGLVSHRWSDDWDASLALHAQDSYHAGGFSQPQRGYVRVDARAARRLRTRWGEAELSLSVENLFDTRYTEFRHDNVAGRRMWVTLSFERAP